MAWRSARVAHDSDAGAEAGQIPGSIRQCAQSSPGRRVERASSDGSVAAASVENDVAVQQTFWNAEGLIVKDLRSGLDFRQIRRRNRTEITSIPLILGALLDNMQFPTSRTGG
jgi:hypothetical protein